MVERLGGTDVDMLEINISCPNVKAGALAFGQDPKVAEDITAAIKKVAKQPVDVYKRQSLVYGIFSFLEKEKNYILAKASLIAAGILYGSVTVCSS